jgi:hypothetical protein
VPSKTRTLRLRKLGYHNWDGGIYYFTLYLDVPVEVFVPVEKNLAELEKTIEASVASITRATGNMRLTNVVVRPRHEGAVRLSPTVIAPVDVKHLWEVGMFRLFLSHVSAHKVGVSAFKDVLKGLGISAFVAHEDIEPTREWHKEIELALGSMHALAALLTPGFHESDWTDQEIGFALGSGTSIIPVRLGLDPYGLMGKLQGVAGRLDQPRALSLRLVDLLVKGRLTSEPMKAGLISAMERASSFQIAIDICKRLRAYTHFSPEQLARLQAAVQGNDQVSNAFGVAEWINELVRRLAPPEEEIPF